MKFEINNYRGITHAAIDASKIAAVFGPNGAGKSSIAGAAKALLSSDPMASTGITKRDAMKIVNDSARSASAILESQTGTNSIEWPDGEVSTTGAPPIASRIALGIDNVLDLDRKKRDSFFAGLLNAEPSFDDLRSQADHFLDAEALKRLWDDLVTNSWDSMSKHYGELATQKKGAWKQITGKNWGSRVATNYVPEHWSPQLDRASLAQLQAVVVDAQLSIESIAACNAIDDAELDALTELAAEIPELRDAIEHKKNVVINSEDRIEDLSDKIVTSDADDALALSERLKGMETLSAQAITRKAKLDKGNAKIKSMIEERNAITTIESSESTPCPSCGTHLVVACDGLSIAPDTISDEENDERQAVRDDLSEKILKAQRWTCDKQAELTKIETEVGALEQFQGFDLPIELEMHENLVRDNNALESTRAEILDLESKLRRATSALEKINTIGAQQNTGATGMDINVAREDLRVATADLESWRQKTTADQTAKTIDHWLELSGILSPGGIRKEILASKLHELNTDIASWSPWTAHIKNDLSVTFDGRPVALCCESEQWRAATILQIMVALRSGDAAVVIDRADILDNRGKNMLFKMLIRMPFRSMVFIKADNRADVLDLGKRNIGISYWVENGECAAI